MTRETIDNVRMRSRGLANREVQDQIGRHLRAIYDEIVEEPIPERFVALLMKLKREQDGSE